jgi:hypothetical protein
MKNCIVFVLICLLSIFAVSQIQGITKKECCDRCKLIEKDCFKEQHEAYIKGLGNEYLDNLKKDCADKIRDCKADCGGGCALLEK